MPIDFEVLDVQLIDRKPQLTIDGPRHVDRWRVTFAGPPGWIAIATADGLPRLRSTPSWDLTSIVDNIAVDVDENGRTDAENPGSAAVVTVQYAPLTWERQRRATHPLEREPVISGGGASITRVDLFDAVGDPMVNSAEDFYTDLPEQFVRAASVTIELNIATGGPARAAAYSNTCNSLAFHGLEPRTCRMGEITFRRVVEEFEGEVVAYWSVAHPISWREDTWDWKPIDRGFGAFVGSTYRPLVDATGNPITEPKLLDGAGAVLTSGDPVVFPSAGYKRVKPVDWTSMDLPNPFAEGT